MILFQQFFMQLPVVTMHGMFADALSMIFFIEDLKQVVPDLYVRNCEVGGGVYDSVYTNISQQLIDLQQCITNDPILQNGFIGIGHSQGGYLMMSYLENHSQSMPPMKRFISLAGPLAGFYCGPDHQFCEVSNLVPDVLIAAQNPDLEYDQEFQSTIGCMNYWKDPRNLERYDKAKIHLSKMQNEFEFKQSYKDNFMSVDKMILFGSDVDGTIEPWQSSWFQFWKPGQDKEVMELNETDYYNDDWFGLKSMINQNRVIIIDSHIMHANYILNKTYIQQEIAPWVVMDK